MIALLFGGKCFYSYVVYVLMTETNISYTLSVCSFIPVFLPAGTAIRNLILLK
jgi:hypothetical protein